MAVKKSLYEVLGIPTNASCQDILAAHRRKLEELQAEEASLERDEFNYRRTVLKVAIETLSDPLARKGYDDKLAAEAPPPARSTAEETQQRALAAAAAEPEVLSRRAQALSLRAEALSLRADAISIETDVSLLPAESAARSLFSRVFGYARSTSRSILTVLGALAIVSMLLQGAYAFFAVRTKATMDTEAVKAEEKIIIQEYYQTYGVRPASAAEARLLMAEREKREREEGEVERERRRIEEQERRFKEESRRVGDQVSADLRNAEERMRREQEYKKAKEQEEERRKAAAEEERLEREQQKWREVLAR